MKSLILTLLLVAGIGFGCVTVTGCHLLGDASGAIAAYEESKANAEAARNGIDALIARYGKIELEWKDAVKSGDVKMADALVDAGTKIVAEINSANESYKAIQKGLDAAVARVKEAEGNSKYLTGILAVLGIGVGALGGRYPLVGKIAELSIGAFKVMAEADKHITPEAYPAFARAVADKTTPSELSAFNKAVGANAVDTAWTGK